MAKLDSKAGIIFFNEIECLCLDGTLHVHNAAVTLLLLYLTFKCLIAIYFHSFLMYK